MFPETSEGTGGSQSEGDANTTGDRVGEEASSVGASATPRTPECEGDEGGTGDYVECTAFPSSGDNSRTGGGATGKGDPQPNRARISKHDFVRTVIACEGNCALAARILGLDGSSVRQRLKRTPELFAIYGNRTDDADLPPPPNEGETLLRTPSQLPTPIPEADLGQMVQTTEKLLGGGLEKLGVPQATITKLRDLSALRIDAGAMLAVSLQDTHQLYYLQLLSLSARADEIYKAYLDVNNPKVEKMDPMARMFWQRAHTEIIEQLGKGYDRMMAGTQAMVSMLKSNKNKKSPGDQKSEAGWSIQVPKSVAKRTDA